MKTVDDYAKIVWDYMHMHHSIEKSDCILVFGSSDTSPAYRACDLYLEGYAPVILFSGNFGQTQHFTKSEAETYAEIAREKGIPVSAILIEDKSRNTGENALFSKRLLEEKNIPHAKIILVQKPYMERRTFATFKKVWPEPEIAVTSPQVTYEDYTTDGKYRPKDMTINRMVGDLIRIREYPKLGFQIEQEIPDHVWQAGQELVKLGYDTYVLA